MTKFTETQTFPTIAYGVLGLSAVAVVWSGLLWPVLLLGMAFNLLCLRTTVTEAQVTVRFGALFPLYQRSIPKADIVSFEVVTYSPIADYGGWGIKWGRGGLALNARGNRGVRLTLRDGRRVLVGSQRPGELAAALGTG